MKTTTPQALLRTARWIVPTATVLIVLCLALMGFIVWWVLSSGGNVPARLVGQLGGPALSALAMVFLIVEYKALTPVLRRHVVDEDTHRCQCSACVRTGFAAPDAPVAKLARPVHSASGAPVLIFTGIIGALLLAIGLAGLVPAVGTGNALLVVLPAVLLAMGISFIAVAIWQRNVLKRALARPADHQCTCRWCRRAFDVDPAFDGQPPVRN